MDIAVLQKTLGNLEARGYSVAEVYAKRGRSRRFEMGPSGQLVVSSEEAGWAVRAGDQSSSFFVAGSGPVEDIAGMEDFPWPQSEGAPLRLPGPAVSPPRSSSSDLDAPTLVEHEAMAMLEAVDAELAREVPGAQLVRAVLEEGSSEALISNSRGVNAKTKSRLATLYLEVVGGSARSLTAIRYLAEREARSFRCKALAQHLANELLIREEEPSTERDRGEFLLDSSVGSQIIQNLLPLLIGAGARKVVARFQDRQGRIGSPLLSIVDDGGLAGGVLEAGIDGEGSPTRRVSLVEEGVYRQPLVPWWEAGDSNWAPSGCVRRASWREPPKAGPTHLFLQPDPTVKVSSLLAAVTRGYYLLGCDGPGEFDLREDRFRLPVWGLVLRQGKPTAALSSSVLVGRISALLHGIQAVSRDLMFAPVQGMLGCPTLLVTGVELQPARNSS
jgi:predicted Zn-dependent protease